MAIIVPFLLVTFGRASWVTQNEQLLLLNADVLWLKVTHWADFSSLQNRASISKQTSTMNR